MCLGLVGGSREGRQRAAFHFIFFPKNSLSGCNCPIKLLSHLLSACPRSAGGLEGHLRHALWDIRLWKWTHDGYEFPSNLILGSLQTRTHLFVSHCATPRYSIFSHDGPYFSCCTRPSSSSQWHCFFSSRHFLFSSYAEETFFDSHRGERAGRL